LLSSARAGSFPNRIEEIESAETGLPGVRTFLEHGPQNIPFKGGQIELDPSMEQFM
jgi:hypothetical protein